ncbi:MAG: DUF3127 domain-containing protein [Bacteroides sp.]|nr:DUF3127 domain-containing protein [Bacteroides sp.]
MAKLTGKILYIYPTQQLTSKSDNPFTKRDFVLVVQSYDRDTGEPTIDEGNTPLLTLTGDRCSRLDNFQVGQMVEVEYNLRGRRYRDKQNKEKIITDINVTSVRPQNQTFPAQVAPGPAPVQPGGTVDPYPANSAGPGSAIPPAPAAQPTRAEDDLPF